HTHRFLGLGRLRLLDDVFHLVQVARPRDAPAAYRAVVGEHALARRLHAGYRALVRLGRLHQLPGAGPAWKAAEVQVVAHQVQKRVRPNERPGAEEGVPVSPRRRGLLGEMQAGAGVARGVSVGRLVAGVDHDADLV